MEIIKNLLDNLGNNDLSNIERYCIDCEEKMQKEWIDFRLEKEEKEDFIIVGPFKSYCCPECGERVLPYDSAKELSDYMNDKNFNYGKIV